MKKKPFDILFELLEENSFNLELHYDGKSKYRFCSVVGRGIRAGFCEFNKESYHYINNRIAADNHKCFDKWSKCPYIVKLPKNKAEANQILVNLRWLSMPEAHDWSNRFAYIDDKKLPRDI